MDKMEWGNEIGTVYSARMPLKIVQGAQYMNDAVGSVFGKLTQACNYQKNSEFYGGIWDSTSVAKIVPTEPTNLDLSNKFPNKIFSLDEILSCENGEDIEMKYDGDLTTEHNKPTKVNAVTLCTEVSFDVKSKRWPSQEFDKPSLPCNETTRKKSKKNVSFSDTLVDMENSSKTSEFNKSSDKTVRNGVIIKMEDNTNNLKVTVNSKESKQINSVTSSRDNNDVLIKKEDNTSVPQEKSAVTESVKVKSCRKLKSQQKEHMQIKLESSEKLVKASLNKKSKGNDLCKTIPEKVDDNHKSKKEEFINHNHLKNMIPELFNFDEFENMDKIEHKESKQKDQLNKVQKIKTLQSSKKNFPTKVDQLSYRMDLSKNEIASNSSEDDIDLKQKDEIQLKNLSKKILNDTNIAETITTQIVKLSEQKSKMNDESEKVNNLSNKQADFFPKVKWDKSHEERSIMKQACNSVKLSEDVSQYKYMNKTKQIEEKFKCQTLQPAKSLNNQPLFEKNVQIGKDLIKEKQTKGTVENSGKIPTTAYQDERNFDNFNSKSRSDSCSNWRNECIDVREKNMKESAVPRSPAPSNWKSIRSQHYETSGHSNNYSKRIVIKKQLENDVLSKTEYVDDPVVVIPLNLSEPPNPITRFKVNTDPESIWDEPEVKTIEFCNGYSWNENKNVKNDSKIEEIHAQLSRKNKPSSVPRFFDNPTRTYLSSKSHEVPEDIKHCSPRKTESNSLVKLNGNNRSRSLSRQENANHHRSFERNRSSSVHWRSHVPLAAHDVFFIIKIKNLQDGTVEKFKILKEDFLEVKKENTKLSDIIPYPGYKPRNVDYSSCAVIMFVRCVFSLSYKIPNYRTALEAFSLAKKFGIDDLKKECQDYFEDYKIPSDQMEDVAICAKHLNAIDAFKATKNFQSIKNFPVQNVFTSQSCSVSCDVLTEPSEFIIPLLSEVNRGLESCNEIDVTNTLIFRSLSGVTCLSGLQFKFLTEDINAQLNIVCEVFQNKEKLFFRELDVKVKPSIKISFEDEIRIKFSESVEINIMIDDPPLKIFPQLTDNEFVGHGKFHAKFESSKSSERNKKLFCIEKLFYT